MIIEVNCIFFQKIPAIEIIFKNNNTIRTTYSLKISQTKYCLIFIVSQKVSDLLRQFKICNILAKQIEINCSKRFQSYNTLNQNISKQLQIWIYVDELLNYNSQIHFVEVYVHSIKKLLCREQKEYSIITRQVKQNMLRDVDYYSQIRI
ncbi:unnamed protein product [Paramecium primaurelia]|uniref:Uncharacterized protein n=1 Tax=Paramecium primaurelia TaxID=5886 RepID=A0A8S1MI35_PARPR|nr:unnamed protein product [Paramecium primaurelia]